MPDMQREGEGSVSEGGSVRRKLQEEEENEEEEEGHIDKREKKNNCELRITNKQKKSWC